MEKDMATHSSILAWRIPWTEEPGGLQSKGLQKSQTPLKLLTPLGRTGKTKPKDWACGPNLQHSLCDLNFSFLLYESQHPYLSVRVACTSWENIPGWSSSQITLIFQTAWRGQPLGTIQIHPGDRSYFSDITATLQCEEQREDVQLKKSTFFSAIRNSFGKPTSSLLLVFL